MIDMKEKTPISNFLEMHTYIGTIHILLGLKEDKFCLFSIILKTCLREVQGREPQKPKKVIYEWSHT